MKGRTMHAVAPPEAAGRRFDQVLAGLFPEYSRSRLAAWIKAGKAKLDGAVVAPGVTSALEGKVVPAVTLLMADLIAPALLSESGVSPFVVWVP